MQRQSGGIRRFLLQEKPLSALHARHGRTGNFPDDRPACREEKWTPEDIPYVRIEHATDPSDDSLKKAAGHGISFVTQPIFLYAESKSYQANLGQEWTRRCYPIRHILDEGVVLGFSTDAPATFWAVPSDPFPGIKLAVTRTAADGTDCGRDQAVDAETAVRLYTARGSAGRRFPGHGNAGSRIPRGLRGAQR